MEREREHFERPAHPLDELREKARTTAIILPSSTSQSAPYAYLPVNGRTLTFCATMFSLELAPAPLELVIVLVGDRGVEGAVDMVDAVVEPEV